MAYDCNDEIKSFISKYKNTRYLIEPYSDEWVSSAEQRSQNGEINFESGVDTYKLLDEEYGPEYRNHLLMIHVDPHKHDLIDDLKKVSKSLEFIFNETGENFGTHKPDFLFFNLATQQIFCVGLGRKNRLMQYDACRYAEKISSTEIDFLERSNTENDDSEYRNNFTALDHEGYIVKLIFDLKILGESLVDYECLDYNPEMSYELNDDGAIEFENGRDSVSEEELEALNDRYDIISTNIEESIDGINIFFPEITPADLNNID
jgi:hypothetical protein